MGDRFVYIRIDSENQDTRKASGLQSIRNTGSEIAMRKELADAVGGVIAGMSTHDTALTEQENIKLLDAANIVTMARTAVEHDYKGDVIDSHAPEMPTRFVKQLAQMVRGGIAIGMTRDRAMRLAIRCAKDSIPPLRIEILLHIAQNPGSQVSHVRKRINKPWTTIRRELQGLHMLGMLRCEEEETMTQSCQGKIIFCYSLAEDFDRSTLLAMTGKTAPPKMWKVPLSSPYLSV
jgi:predicted transcriptional regulator